MVVRATGIGLVTGLLLAVGVGLTLVWPDLRVVWPLVLVPVIPTGAFAVHGALPPRAGSTRAALAGLVAGTVAGMVSAAVLYAASSHEPAWNLVGVLRAPPLGLGPYDWFGPVPWPLPLIAPLGAALAAVQAWLYYRLLVDPAADVQGRLADWVARRPAGLQSKLLAGFLALVASTFLVGSLGLAAMEDMHQRLHVLELRAEWLGHLRTVQSAVEAEREILADLAVAPRVGALQRLRELDTQVQAELTHLTNYPPHAAFIMNEAHRRRELATLGPLVTAVRAPYAAFSGALQEAASSYMAGDRVGASALAESLAPAQSELGHALGQLAGELGEGLLGVMLQMDADHHASELGLMVLVLLFTALAGLLAIVFARAIVRPVRATCEQLRRMGQGDFSRRLTVPNADELGQLAQDVNRVNGELAGLYEQQRDHATNLEQQVAAQVAEIEGVRHLQRYLPQQLVERVTRGEITVSGQHERRKVTILFADMEGFTDLSDSVEAEELGQLLNEYFGVMSDAVFRHGGTLLDFIGDAVMVVFGAPQEPQPSDDARRAVELGLDMQGAASEWAASWRQRGLDRAPAVRIGIHSGYATVGTFGTSARTEYAAIGRTTNLAARVQTAAPAGGLLVTWATRALAGDNFHYASRGELQAKGLHTPVEVFAVTALDGTGPSG